MFNDVRPLPDWPIINPRSDQAKRATQLYEDAKAALDRVIACSQAARASRDGIRVAEAALDAHLTASATTGKSDPKTEIELVRALEDARIAADPRLHERRRLVAAKLQHDAHLQWQSYTQMYMADLLEEMRPEGGKVTEELAAARAALAPVELRYQEFAGRVNALTSVITRQSVNAVKEWALPVDHSEVPLPSAEVVARHVRRHAPAVAPDPEPNPEPEVQGTPGWNL